MSTQTVEYLPAYCNPDNKVIGNNYEPGLSCKDIAKKLRLAVKNFIKIGVLPKDLKVSVLSTYNTINMYVKKVPNDELYNPEYLELTKNMTDFSYDPCEYRDIPRYTDQVNNVIDFLTTLLDSYNYNNSDIMSDYFDVNYYGRAEVGWEYRTEVEKNLSK